MANETAAIKQTPLKPLCFVLMPFGEKPDAGGGTIDFDKVYEQVIRPAIVDAGMESIRADEEKVGGIIHKPMFERLLLCDYAVADLTSANANVYYELGIRHAVRPHSTVAIFADDTRLPFDVSLLRGMAYQLNENGLPADADMSVKQLSRKLTETKGQSAVDSPLFQLLTDIRPPDVSHLKTNVFRERVRYSEFVKQAMQEARNANSRDSLLDIKTGIGSVSEVESGVLVDLLLSFRSVEAWGDMAELVEEVPEPLAQTPLVREQYAFALNRDGRSAEAERVLIELIDQHGPSSETYGLLGRVYKDRWESETAAGKDILAAGYLDSAVDAYVNGFNTDWRDAYPGINALTLMELGSEPDPRQAEILPVVRYSVQRRLDDQKPDYWAVATMVEIEVLAQNEGDAMKWLTKSLPLIREPWEPKTTARNLRLIREANEARGETREWVKTIETELLRNA